MVVLLRILLQLLGDAAWFLRFALRPTRVVVAEDLFLRRQLALYRERGLKPRRFDIAPRLSLALLSRLFDWHSALVVVRPGIGPDLQYSGAGSLGPGGHRLQRSCVN